MTANDYFGFRSRTAAKAEAKRILREYDGRYGVPITGEDAEFVTAILLNHPALEHKIGQASNIEHHVVLKDGTNSRWGRGFRTKRKDNGELVEWSYTTAIDGRHREQRRDVEVALRREVDPWVKAQGEVYDRSPDGGYCFLAFEPLVPGETELHHADPWPFRRIVYEFMFSPYMRARELGWEDIKLKKVAVGVWLLEDRKLAQAFIDFHADLAVIERVSKAGHKWINARDAATLAAAGVAKQGWAPYYGALEFPDDLSTEEGAA